MLCEFALTPQLFDDEQNRDDPNWKEHLRELGRAMFPRATASPIVVSDLYDGSWRHVFKETVEAISDPGAKDLARSFVAMILDAAVTRPAIGDWPEDEDAWARQALETNAVEPLKKIVVTDQAFPVVEEKRAAAMKLSDVASPGCWEDIVSGRSLAMNITTQVAALRPLLIHSDFIGFVSPHVRGVAGDESDFVLAMIRSLGRCAWPRPNLLVDLHVEAPDRVGASDFEARWNNALSNLRTTFHPVRPLVKRLRVFAWQKLLNRYVLGGRTTEVSGAIVPVGARWVISTPHVARMGDAADIDQPFWQILPPADATPLHSKHYDRPPLRGPIDL